MAKRFRDLEARTLSKERRDRIDRRVEQELLEMNLRSLRELMGKTQEEMSRLVEMSQGQVSMTERRSDHLLSTLRRYVEALGGELEVVASFGDKRIRLSGI